MTNQVIDFTTRRAVVQSGAPAPVPPRAPKSPKPARTPRPNGAKIGKKSGLSRIANDTASKVESLSYEVSRLKRSIAALLDEYDAKIKTVAYRVAGTVRKLRDEAHERVDLEGV